MICTSKRAIFMRSVDRRNAVSAQEPKRFALSSQRKLAYLLVAGIIILSAKECEMGPGGGSPNPVVNDPFASTGPLVIARAVEVNHGQPLLPDDRFGISVAFAGNLDGKGGTVLAVGASTSRGFNDDAIYLLSYDPTGALQSTKRIGHGVDETNEGAATKNTPTLVRGERFGASIANAGNLYGGGNTVLAVGATGDDTDGTDAGAIYLLSFNTSGSLTNTTKITSEMDKGLSLANRDGFGSSIANAGDLDGGGGTVLAVGAQGDDTGGDNRGAMYLLSFNGNGVLQNTKKIAHGLDGTNTASNNNAPTIIDEDANFGNSIANAGDLDGGGGTVLAVGAWGDNTGGDAKGAMYLLSFNGNGVLQNTKKIAHDLDETNATSNNNAPTIGDQASFGSSIANAGDLDGGGGTVLAVGAFLAFDTIGAVFLLSFDATGRITAPVIQMSSRGLEPRNPPTDGGDRFGSSLANAGNLDGRGGRVLAVGRPGSWAAQTNKTGALQLLYFSPPAEDE